MRRLLAIALSLAAAAHAQEEPPPAPVPTPTAFEVTAKLPVGFAVNGSETGDPVPALPVLFLGVRVGRVSVLLGASFVRGASGSSSESDVTFAPTVSFDLFRSADHRAALFGLFAPLLGVQIGNSDQNAVYGYQLAVGGRYLFHPHFALGVEGGFAGFWYAGSPGGDTRYNLNQIYAALAGSFYVF